MSRIKANGETIRNEIKRRINTSTELDGDCRDCGAPTPRSIEPTKNNGCNWTVDIFPSLTPGCLDLVSRITRDVMEAYELVD